MAILSNINGLFAVEDNGAIKFNNLTGTNNQVLIANTNSSPTWVDVDTIIGGPYLPLTGGTLAGAGNLVVGGTLAVNGVTTLNANVLMGNTVTNPASGFTDQTGIGLKYSTTVPEIQVSSDSAAMQLGRTSTGGEGQILGLRKAGNIIHNFDTNNVSIGTNATFAGNVTLASGKYLGVGNTTPAGTRSKLGVSFNVTGSAANLAESVTYATMELYPYRNGSTYGMFFGNKGVTNGYIQSANNAGNASGHIFLNPFGGNIGIGTGNNVPDFALDIEAVDSGVQLQMGRTNTSAGSTWMGSDSNGFHLGVGAYGAGNSAADPNGFTVLTSGNVGIGTASPTSKLHLRDPGTNSDVGIKIGNDSRDWNLQVMGSVSDSFQIFTHDNSNVMTILPSGNVGIGTDSPEFKLDVKSNSDTAPSVYLRGGKSSQGEIQNTGLIIGTQTTMVAGDYQGISFTGYTSSSAIRRGRAAIGVEAINGPGKMDLVFMTRFADDGTQLTSADEKMRITSGGDVLISTTTAITTSATYSNITLDGSMTVGPNLGAISADASINVKEFGGKQISFFYGTTKVGGITSTSSATAYNTSSDYRLKEDLQDFAGLDMVSKIPVYDFKWKTDKSRSYGVMAHELEEVLPKAVNGEKDAEEMQSVDYSKVVPLLVKSIQELEARIKILENK